MALINCPECSQLVSDKAPKCPHCGIPLAIEAESEAANSPNEGRKTSGKKNRILPIIIPVIAVLIIAIVVALLFVLDTPLRLSKKTKVEDLTLSKWQLTDEGKYTDNYDVTLSSSTKKPFLAVIGYYTEDDSYPKIAYVENGEGKMNVSVKAGEDPSLTYRPIGYLAGKKISINEYTSSIKDSDYEDFTSSDYTSCELTIDIKFKDKRTGLFCFDIVNDMTKYQKKDLIVCVVNGECHYETILSDLPLKSRGVSAKMVPKYFCDATNIDSSFTVDKEFSVVEEGSYLTYYTGTEKYSVNGVTNGLLLYDKKCVSGGEKKNQNVTFQGFSYIRDGKGEIITLDWDLDDEKMLKPQYEINHNGIIRFNEIK